jgi:hypothetical protein
MPMCGALTPSLRLCCTSVSSLTATCSVRTCRALKRSGSSRAQRRRTYHSLVARIEHYDDPDAPEPNSLVPVREVREETGLDIEIDGIVRRASPYVG